MSLICPPVRRKYNRRDCCLEPEEPPKRPDPSLYSQSRSFSDGIPVTWNSPDILTHITALNMAWVLMPKTRVTVRNLSVESTAIGAVVAVTYTQFGIGYPRNALGMAKVNLNRYGTNGHEQELQFPLLQEILDSQWRDLSVFVEVSHPHDRDVTNNVGAQSFSGGDGTAGQAYNFFFPIHNSTNAAQTFKLSVSGDWSPQLDKNQVMLIPGQHAHVQLTVNPPSNASGSKEYDVTALTESGALYGGIHHRLSL